MRARRVAMLIVATLWAAQALRIYSVWDQLPARMATHFGPSGAADGWMSKPGFVLFSALVGGGLTLLFLFAQSWMHALPSEFLNLPYRSYWLAEARREAGLARVAESMIWLGVLMAALMFAIDELTLRANLGGDVVLDGRLFLWVMIAFLTALAVWMVVLYRRMRPPRES